VTEALKKILSENSKSGRVATLREQGEMLIQQAEALEQEGAES